MTLHVSLHETCCTNERYAEFCLWLEAKDGAASLLTVRMRTIAGKWWNKTSQRVGSSPARLSDRKCTSGACRARSSHPCRSLRRSYKAGKWSPSHSRAHTAPTGGEETNSHFTRILFIIILILFVNFCWALQRFPSCSITEDWPGWLTEEKQTRPNLSDFDVVLWGRFTQPRQVRVLSTTIWEQIAGEQDAGKYTQAHAPTEENSLPQTDDNSSSSQHRT